MNELETKDVWISEYVKLKRIANAPDKMKEIDKQLAELEVKMKSAGILLQDLEKVEW